MSSPQNRPFAQQPESFVHSLLGAQDISALAFIAEGHLRRMGLRLVMLTVTPEGLSTRRGVGQDAVSTARPQPDANQRRAGWTWITRQSADWPLGREVMMQACLADADLVGNIRIAKAIEPTLLH